MTATKNVMFGFEMSAARLLRLMMALLAAFACAQSGKAAGVVSVCDEAHLRAALSGGGLVTFTCSGDITLAKYINVTSSTIIDATGYNVTLDGQNNIQIMLLAGINLSMNHLTIANGTHGDTGGIFMEGGSLQVTNCTFLNNQGGTQGGALGNQHGQLIVVNSTFIGNTGINGGAIHSDAAATLLVVNSTFSSNGATQGAAVYNNNASATIINSTLSGNSSGVYTIHGTVTLENTIAVQNGGADCSIDIGGALTDGGYNLDDDGTCGLTSANSFGSDKKANLAPLASNGGATQTFALNYPSDAIGVIPPGTNGCGTNLASDQRGVARPGNVNGNCSIGAYEYVSGSASGDSTPVTTITNCTNDTQLQNALLVGGRIIFACSGDIGLTKTLTVANNTIVDGTGQIVTLDGQNKLGVMSVNYGSALTVNNLTIASGSAALIGAGINSSGQLVVLNSTVSGNSSTGQGGGIESLGSLVVTNSTLSGNSAGTEGGAIFAARAMISNSSLSGNSASLGSGINGGNLTLTGSTVSGNSGRAAVMGSLVSLTNSILANNGVNCDVLTRDGGYNLADDTSCGLSAAGSQNGATGINLGSLSNNGGPTLTFPLNNGSIALAAIPVGSNGCGANIPILTDQRGVLRPQGPACDIGAFQTAQNQTPITFSTIPGNLSYSVGPSIYSSQQTLTLPVGTQSTIWTPSPQTTTGTQYTFANWSDSGAQAHQLGISPALSSPVTANFNTSYLLTTAVNPSGAGAVSVSASAAGSNGYYQAGTQISLSANANPGYAFSNWTGTLASASSPLSVLLNSPVAETANFVPTVQVTVGTSPGGLSVIVDGQTLAAPAVVTWVVGSSHTIGTTTLQTLSGVPYQFSAWSDAGAISHSVTASSAITNYTATFVPAVTFTITPNPPSETVLAGNIAAFVLTLKSVNGFKGNVKLSCAGGPSGSYCTDFPMTVPVNGTAYAISGIFFPKTTTLGTYTITFTGVSGSQTVTGSAKFIVK